MKLNMKKITVAILGVVMMSGVCVASANAAPPSPPQHQQHSAAPGVKASKQYHKPGKPNKPHHKAHKKGKCNMAKHGHAPRHKQMSNKTQLSCSKNAHFQHCYRVYK